MIPDQEREVLASPDLMNLGEAKGELTQKSDNFVIVTVNIRVSIT